MEARAITETEKQHSAPAADRRRGKVYMFNTGCIRRGLDCTRIHRYLKANGWEFTSRVRAADVIIVSTCGTIKKNERLSLAAIKTVAKRKAAHARVIITGCLPKIHPEAIAALGQFEYVPTRHTSDLDTLLDSRVKYDEIPDVNLVSNDLGFLDYVLAYRLFRNSYSLNLYTRLSTIQTFNKLCVFLGDTSNRLKSRLGLAKRQEIVPYYNLRISEGCAFACSYCAIKFATGKLTSKPIPDIVSEFRTGLAGGHKMFQLVSEDTGCYGIDSGATVVDLLRELLAVKGDYQLLLIDFGGHWLVKYYNDLLPLFEAHAAKIKEIYVSLQSGSNKILKAMNRPEKAEEVRARLKDLKQRVPQINLRTTVILGFPGETEEDFQQTVEAIRDLGFAEVQLNKYEDRPGTVSSRMDQKVPREVIDKRYEVIKQYC